MEDAVIRVLLVEDNPGDARLIREMLRDSGPRKSTMDLSFADRLSGGLERLRSEKFDLVLLDLTLPDSSGLETFESVHSAAPSVPIVVLSGLDDEAVAVRAVQFGAQDYLVKGQVDGGAILRSMRYAIERQRLEDARADLEHQRDEFFSSVSHDLRTPVAAIKAAIGVVLANEPQNMPASLHRLLGNIDLAADELTKLIENLLEMARLQAGRVELWRSPVDLREVVARAVRNIEPLAAERNQTLVVQVPDQPVVAEVDGERLGRVLRNLLANAQKYGREGGRIWLALEDRTDEVCISVTDDGPGIAAEDQQRIFERFYRVSGSTTTGTGLGLAIARALVELHGGRLSVESAAGAGSTFFITLAKKRSDS
ncbi:MAG: hybrid sensor histidine kinase/response regulator [Chloroflexi bacterium]|nr:hybrid sensor histidine kinase/response regulator [Chloroflexota bacterium]